MKTLALAFVANANKPAKIVPKGVLDAVTRDGHVSGVPIPRQGTNFLFATADAPAGSMQGCRQAGIGR
ncbi:hypothetical protein [Tropicibacter sp. S64]|uniref:hypothetical protein n=1 Tax=Tropicibacter sp. S64 TaxID=3415122 RepID=UPI003C7B3B19